MTMRYIWLKEKYIHHSKFVKKKKNETKQLVLLDASNVEDIDLLHGMT